MHRNDVIIFTEGNCSETLCGIKIMNRIALIECRHLPREGEWMADSEIWDFFCIWNLIQIFPKVYFLL